jgi:hypothetical protein
MSVDGQGAGRMIEDEEDGFVLSYKSTRKEIEKGRAVRIFLSHLVAFILGNALSDFRTR